MSEVIRLENYKETNAIYIFCDIRDFTSWSQKHQNEIKKLTKILYSLAIEVFGQRKKATLTHRIVKFLGDGFFAISEYDDDDTESFPMSLGVTFQNILNFIQAFYLGIAQSNLHDKGEIKVSFGVSYGPSFRFHIPGQPLDFIGTKINLAARLCSISANSEIVIEYDLKSHTKETEVGQRQNIEYNDDRIDLRGIGDTVVCRMTDKKSFLYEYNDYRHLSALVDLIKKATQ
jgi:class 3 adenylate cyclase